MISDYDPKKFEELLREVIATNGAPFDGFTFANPPYWDTTLNVVNNDYVDAIQISTGTTSGDATVVTTTGTYQMPSTIWVGDTIPNPQITSPFNDAYVRRLRQRFGTDSQDITLPENMEMLKECQIQDVIDDEGVVLEFRIKGPIVPKGMIEKLPEAMFKILDLEIKRAMIRAFQLVPKEEIRKRTLILDEV